MVPKQRQQQQEQQRFNHDLNLRRATRFMEAHGFKVYQRNGQRISIRDGQSFSSAASNSNSTSSTSLSDDREQTEVFVGKLPRDLFEDELYPLVEQAGRIKRLRLMMNFSGTNRGFAFVDYETSSEASYACQLLQGRSLRPGTSSIGVLMSFDNRRLFIGNLPPNCNRAMLARELDRVLAGVVHVSMSHGNNGGNDKRFAHVTFQSHDAATQARRILMPGNVKICGVNVTVDWARAEQPVVPNPQTSTRPDINILSSSSPPTNNNNNNHSDQINYNNMPWLQGHALIRRDPAIGCNNYVNYCCCNRVMDRANYPPMAPTPCVDTSPSTFYGGSPLIAPTLSPSPAVDMAQSILGVTAKRMLDACPPVQPPIDEFFSTLYLRLLS